MISISFYACQDDEGASPTTETAVVEAYLFAGKLIDTVKISQSLSYSSSDSLISTLDDLEVFVSDDINSVQLDFIGNGTYQNLDLRIQNGQSYSLEFEYNERLITADTYVPDQKKVTASTDEITMDKIESGTFPDFSNLPDPIELEWENPEGDYYYVVVENTEEDPETINELFEDFGIAFNFTSDPEIMDFYAINPRREIQQFGRHRIIVFRVNPEYAALYETSGTTSTTIAEPPSNVDNGLGLFTGVSSDTLWLNVKKG